MAGENGHPHPPRLATAVVAVIAAVVVVLGVTGCGSDDDDALEGTPEDATATTTSTTVVPSTTAPGDGPGTTSDTPPAVGVLVEMNTSGGLDGRGMGSLVVTTDGVVRRFGDEDPVEQDALAPEELDALVVLLDETDFAELPAEPPNGTSCADAFVYTVRYAEWTVRADDCTLPEALAPLLDRLQDILARFD